MNMEINPCPICGGRVQVKWMEKDREYLVLHFSNGICAAAGWRTYSDVDTALESWRVRSPVTNNRERIIELVEELSDLVGGV